MFIQIKIVLIAFAFYFAKVVKFGRPKMILNVKNILITFSDKFFAFPFDNIYLPMRRSEKHFNIFNIDWTKMPTLIAHIAMMVHAVPCNRMDLSLNQATVVDVGLTLWPTILARLIWNVRSMLWQNGQAC